MKTVWTLADLKKSPVAKLNPHLFEQPKKKAEKRISKEKLWMELRLQDFAKEHGLTLVPEYKFCEERKWRNDWVLLELKVAFEYEGIFSAKSRHTTAKGFTGDKEKYNKAQELGWKVYCYTAINYHDLRLDLLNLKL